MDNISQNLGIFVIVVFAILVVYMLFEPQVSNDVSPLHVETPVADKAIQENVSGQELVNELENGLEHKEALEEMNIDDSDLGFAPVNNIQKCSCGCSNCSCNPSSCKCGKIMNASDQMAVAVQGKSMIYNCGCGCSNKNKPSVSVSNPEFLNEWTNFRSNANQNSNNITHDTVDLIHQMYVDDNMMPSRKYKGKTVADVFDKLTNKSDFMRCVRLPSMEDQPMAGVNAYDPTKINF